MYDVIVNLFLRSFDFLYKWLSENLLAHFLTFTKEFGAVIVFISAVVFLLIAVYLIMKQARRMPKHYSIETFDANGNPAIIPELRVTFATYQAAASYAQFYTTLYGDMYKFRLLGIKDNVSILKR